MSTFSMNWTSGLRRDEVPVRVVGLAGVVADVLRPFFSVLTNFASGIAAMIVCTKRLHAALRPELGRVAAGHGEDLEVLAVRLHPVEHDLRRLRAFLHRHLREVGELVAVRRDADGEHRDALVHQLVGDRGESRPRWPARSRCSRSRPRRAWPRSARPAGWGRSGPARSTRSSADRSPCPQRSPPCTPAAYCGEKSGMPEAW